jgi:hypothetical protein
VAAASLVAAREGHGIDMVAAAAAAAVTHIQFVEAFAGVGPEAAVAAAVAEGIHIDSSELLASGLDSEYLHHTQ